MHFLRTHITLDLTGKAWCRHIVAIRNIGPFDGCLKPIHFLDIDDEIHITISIRFDSSETQGLNILCVVCL